ncbi:MAG: MlaD family protein, partial [Rhodospirillales bacterium]|nr:MlaD family protein [Rhodospirillales bacterium]
MRSGKVNYLIVGGFVIVMMTALVVSVALLTGRTGATDGYFTVYRNVTGVKFGTQVLYEGYPIGQVETVTPVEAEGGMRFRVEYTVREGWLIPEDSVAQIAAPGLLSALTI